MISHVIYFEIPGCEQISWHFSPDSGKEFPVYVKKRDGKRNSTLFKLEETVRRILDEDCWSD